MEHEVDQLARADGLVAICVEVFHLLRKSGELDDVAIHWQGMFRRGDLMIDEDRNGWLKGRLRAGSVAR